MKKLVTTTAKVDSPLSTLKLERLTGESLTDKAMSTLATDRICGITDMHIYEVDTPDGYVEQAIIECENGVYSTCSSVAISLVNELIDIVNNGDASLDDITLDVKVSISRDGNKYLNLIIV